jgi:gas vesicle structural protein
MTVMTQASGGGGRSGSLYDVIELILDRGLVIDAFVRVSLLGIEVLTVEARVVVASVDTYLRFAETASRLQLTASSDTKTLPELVGAIAEDDTKNGSKLVQSRKEGSR